MSGSGQPARELRRLQKLDHEGDAGDGQCQEEQDDRDDGEGAHPPGDDTGPAMRSVRFLTRTPCRICAEALPLVERGAHRRGWVLEGVDVAQAGLDVQYGDRVPVVLVDGVEVLSGRFGKREVRRALR